MLRKQQIQHAETLDKAMSVDFPEKPIIIRRQKKLKKRSIEITQDQPKILKRKRIIKGFLNEKRKVPGKMQKGWGVKSHRKRVGITELSN